MSEFLPSYYLKFKEEKVYLSLMGLIPKQMKYVQIFAKFLLISEINLKLSKIRCLLQYCVGKKDMLQA